MNYQYTYDTMDDINGKTNNELGGNKSQGQT